MTKLLFLGTGASFGIPEPTCDCIVCTAARDTTSRFFRTRSSILITHRGKNILVDPGTDFWFQCVRQNVRQIDAVLLTHIHEDHSGGIPDLRNFSSSHSDNPPLPFFVHEKELPDLRKRFGYIFDEKVVSTKPKFDVRLLDEKFDLFGLPITMLPVVHSTETTVGFRFNDLAYIPDALSIPDTTMELMKGISTLVIMGNSDKKYTKQMSIFESIEYAKKTGAKRVLFTHIGHRIERLDLEKILPPNMSLAFDGLQIEF